jgi:hypothetical protein
MEVPGAETYTVSQSSTTGKWTIATGGAYLSLLRSTGTNVANSVWTAIGFTTAADSTGSLTYTGANIALHTEESIVFDLTTAEAIDSFAMLFNPIAGEGVKFSDAAVLKLQANATASWSAPSVDVTLSIDATYDVITHFFSSDQTYRYWRLKIVDPRNAYLYVEVPKVILSKATQLGQLPEIGFGYSLRDQSKITETAYGHRYSDSYPARRAYEFNYEAMAEDDIETLQQIFERVGNVTPIAIALDPLATVFDKDRFFLYGYLNDQFKTSNRFYTYFGSGLRIEEAM